MSAERKRTPEEVIEALHASHGLISVAAKKLGFRTRTTLYDYIETYPEVKEALHEARELVTDMAEAALYGRIKAGDGWAVCFYLKTQGRKRGYAERHEFAAAEDAPAPVVNIMLTVKKEPREPSDAKH